KEGAQNAGLSNNVLRSLSGTGIASDSTPPDTSITAHPTDPSSSSAASFSFAGTDNVTPPGSLTFECKLDAGAFAPCTSPKSYSSLLDGSHTFQGRAKDGANNIDLPPPSFAWVVDTTRPDTAITSHPTDPSGSASAS